MCGLHIELIIVRTFLILKPSKQKKLHELLRGSGRGVNRTAPSTFDRTHPFGIIFGTYNKLPLYFQLSETSHGV